MSLLSMPAAQAAARADVLRRLELAVQRRLDGREPGDHVSSAYGPGSERASARPYGWGDDARLVDWNLTARSGELFVRQTEADRELETWVLADRSASLDFGTTEGEKRDVVLGATAAFGVLSLRGSNRLGLVLTGAGPIRVVPARKGRTALLAGLAAVHDTPRQDGAPEPEHDLAAGLARLAAVAQRRGRIVVVSDFLSLDEWVEPLRALARRHQVIGVHVTDPRELELPAVGIVAVVDAETGRQRYVDTSARLRDRYAAAAASRQHDIAQRIRSTSASYLHLSTDRDWLSDTVAFATRERPRAGRLEAIARFGTVVAR